MSNCKEKWVRCETSDRKTEFVKLTTVSAIEVAETSVSFRSDNVWYTREFDSPKEAERFLQQIFELLNIQII